MNEGMGKFGDWEGLWCHPQKEMRSPTFLLWVREEEGVSWDDCEVGPGSTPGFEDRKEGWLFACDLPQQPP